jgi:hypothetical protein
MMWFMAGDSLIHGGLRLSSASHAFHTNRKGKEMSLLACKAHSCTDARVHSRQLLSTNRDSKWQINFEAGIHCLPTGKRIKAIDPQFAVWHTQAKQVTMIKDLWLASLPGAGYSHSLGSNPLFK